MKTPIKTLLALALLALAGCASVPTPTPAEAAAADYGPAPTGQTQDIVKAFMELRLKDPASAQYKFPELLQKTWMKGGALSGVGVLYGYRADVLINARNSYGGYTGFQPYGFLIRDGRVVAYTEHANDPAAIWWPVK